MLRASLALICVLCCVACTTSDPVSLPTDIDAEPQPLDAGGILDLSIQDAIAIDVGDDGGALQDGGDPGDVAVTDAGVTAEACQTIHNEAAPIELPSTDQVTAAYGGEVTYLAWADTNGVHQCTVGASGEFEGPLTPIEAPEFPVDAVVSLRTSGTSWVAYGGENEPIRLYQAHRPNETLTLLDGEGSTLVGRPQLADAAGSIMVIGQTPDGALAWHIIPADFSDRQFFYRDTAGFGWPNSVGTVEGGVYLRFGTEGQCVFVSDVEWMPVGTLPCDEGVGELVSDGQRSILWNSERRGAEEFLSLSSLTDKEIDFVSVGKAISSAEMAMSVYRGQKPLIGTRFIPQPQGRIGHAQLSLSGPSGIWMSRDTWSQWPWADARAISFSDLPERAGEGTCGPEEGGAPCMLDADCCSDLDDPSAEDDCLDGPDALCNGSAESRHALIFRFQSYGRPEISYLPMGRPNFALTGSLFEDGSACSPSPEVCDGRDQDCDGYVDDGICCPATAHGVLKIDFSTEGPIQEFILGDNEWRNAFILSHRQTDAEGRSFWRTHRFKYTLTDIDERPDQQQWVNAGLEGEYVRDCNQTGMVGRCNGGRRLPCRDDFECEDGHLCQDLEPVRCYENPEGRDSSASTIRYAGDVAYMNGVGGTRAMVAKTPADHPSPNQWAVHWLHWTRDLKGHADEPVLLPEACDEILAAEGLRRVDEGESVIIVCPDRLIRAYASLDRPDQQWRFSELGLPNVERIEWASINREWVQSTCGADTCQRHDSGFKLLVAYRTSVGTLNLELYNVLTGSDGPPSRWEFPEPLDQLKQSGADELKLHPIYLNKHPAGPPIRITDGNKPQALFEVRDANGDDQLEWRDTVTVAAPDKAVFSIMNEQVFTGAAVLDAEGQEIGYQHWLINTASDDEQYNLWSTTPISTENRPVAFWGTVHSEHSHTLLKVVPLNEGRTQWEFSASSYSCTDAK